jgi:hypothetical protein
MLIVFPKRATMIVTPGEPDVTKPCGEMPAPPGLVEDLSRVGAPDCALDRWA